MFCTSCGASNLEDAAFCVNCGESMSRGEEERRSLGSRSSKDIGLLKAEGLFQDLFDFSFHHFCTPRIIHVAYGLSIFSAGLFAILLIVLGFRASTWFGILALLFGAPLIFLLTVMGSRICLEFMVATVRFADALTASRQKIGPQDGIEWNV